MEEVGISCVHPGRNYLFPQALEEDDVAFVRRAQEEKILLVPARLWLAWMLPALVLLPRFGHREFAGGLATIGGELSVGAEL